MAIIDPTNRAFLTPRTALQVTRMAQANGIRAGQSSNMSRANSQGDLIMVGDNEIQLFLIGSEITAANPNLVVINPPYRYFGRMYNRIFQPDGNRVMSYGDTALEIWSLEPMVAGQYCWCVFQAGHWEPIWSPTMAEPSASPFSPSPSSALCDPCPDTNGGTLVVSGVVKCEENGDVVNTTFTLRQYSPTYYSGNMTTEGIRTVIATAEFVGGSWRISVKNSSSTRSYFRSVSFNCAGDTAANEILSCDESIGGIPVAGYGGTAVFTCGSCGCIYPQSETITATFTGATFPVGVSPFDWNPNQSFVLGNYTETIGGLQANKWKAVFVRVTGFDPWHEVFPPYSEVAYAAGVVQVIGEAVDGYVTVYQSFAFNQGCAWFFSGCPGVEMPLTDLNTNPTTGTGSYSCGAISPSTSPSVSPSASPSPSDCIPEDAIGYQVCYLGNTYEWDGSTPFIIGFFKEGATPYEIVFNRRTSEWMLNDLETVIHGVTCGPCPSPSPSPSPSPGLPCGCPGNVYHDGQEWFPGMSGDDYQNYNNGGDPPSIISYKPSDCTWHVGPFGTGDLITSDIACL